MKQITAAPLLAKAMADAVYSGNLAANTLQTVLEDTNVQVKSASASVTWTVQPDPLEIVVTRDGVVENYSFTNPVSATPYILAESVTSLAAAETAQILATTLSATTTFHRIFDARSLKIEVRCGKTTAGTTSNVTCRVKYSKY